MIFVTTGSWRFDELFEAVDIAVKDGEIQEDVLCQIGCGSYIPNHCQYYRYKPSIEEDIQNASFVICHGGGDCLSAFEGRKEIRCRSEP